VRFAPAAAPKDGVGRAVVRERPLLGLALVTLPACAGRQAKFGRGDAKEDLVTPFGQAVEAEQIRGPEAALTAYLALLDRGARELRSSARRRAVLASTDALVTRTAPSLERIGNDHALAYRHPGAMKTVASTSRATTRRPRTRVPSRAASSPGGARARSS